MKAARPLLALTVVVLAFFFAAIVAEIVLRTAFGPTRILGGDAEWESREASASTAESHHGYGFDRFDEDVGWAPKANYRSDDVRTNSDGIRADRQYARDREPGTSRIVVLGDSFTWGEKVSNEEAFVTLLDQRLPRTEAINLAVHGPSNRYWRAGPSGAPCPTSACGRSS